MFRTAYLILAGTMLATTAVAQTNPPAAPATSAAPTTGATVYDAQGDVVGTIASTDGTNAVVDTGTVKAALALSSFGTGAKGPTLGLTKAQLEAAAQQQSGGDIKEKLVPGAAVFGSAGTEVGTIKAADSQFVTLTTAKGDVRLPVTGFGPGAKGVTIGMTAEQLASAIGSAAPKK